MTGAMITPESDGKSREFPDLTRFQRQMVFAPLGLQGQQALMSGRALIVGVGGLGSWCAELLARAGVGLLRLVDDDKVALDNLHRQALYGQADAEQSLPKVHAAAARLRRIAASIKVEPVVCRVSSDNIQALTREIDIILDGTDNFATRYLINDVAVRLNLPWVFAGVVGAEAQTMTILPGRTPCLRCVMDSPPPPCKDPSCRSFGVLGPAVAAIACVQAMEAIKILAGKTDEISPYLTKLDLWTNQWQQIRAADQRRADCPCCAERIFEYLEP